MDTFAQFGGLKLVGAILTCVWEFVKQFILSKLIAGHLETSLGTT